jgi:hypothetical protein
VIHLIRRLVAEPAPAVRTLIVAIAIFHVVSPTRAWAYLDPITGSIVLQVLAAGFLAAAATFRRSREWFSGVLKKWTTDRKQ